MKRTYASARKTDTSLQVDAHSRGIHHTFDEPAALGGSDTGMNPVELELCSLGASLQETAAGLAPAHHFTYRQMTITLEGDLDAAGFMGDPEIRNGFQAIRFNVAFDTDATPEACQNFMDAVEAACPLMDMLKIGIDVELDQVEIV
ncbi:peroxiredoxin [Levilactobacillus zymae]|uniref:Peroxiredoxin n=1 Tax=Levilactobacillus zymae TaxID=267363 RepID=A0ABQ0WY22_9LACO|nr:OsmC family protein [Levilactobacillus zymae]QFR61129.1 OsmC family peroxiredoxin [Levilactobacillus zymae]GEO72006.1 peroxiredoxin [Levilactobacillus zymae]